MTTLREAVAAALHDSAQQEYGDPHTYADCPYQGRYLVDADAALAAIAAAAQVQPVVEPEWLTEARKSAPRGASFSYDPAPQPVVEADERPTPWVCDDCGVPLTHGELNDPDARQWLGAPGDEEPSAVRHTTCPGPVVEADEREVEVLGAAILAYREMWDEAVAGCPPNEAPEGGGGFHSVDMADWLVARGFGRRSQPAPRTVSAEDVRVVASESGRAETVVRDWFRTAGITVEAPREH